MANEGRILIYFDELTMALTRAYGSTMDTHIYSPRDILSFVQGLHRVDAEEVIRCKDCKACPSFDGNGIGYCLEHGNYILENDFCSYGERKDNGKQEG